MESTVIYTSESNNYYLYDNSQKISMVIHPELAKAHETGVESSLYYKNKYRYLKEHGFFLTHTLNTFETTIDESVITDCIAQIQQIVFEVTDSCNLKCIYCINGNCYDGFDKTSNSNNIDVNSADILLKYILNIKSKNKAKGNITISFYGGEPLLNIDFIKHIVEVSEEIKAKNSIDINYSMTTNATLIHKHLSFFVEKNFKILISLDGNEKNNAYRLFKNGSKNSFSKVIENIDLIQRKHPNYFKNNISFNAVLHQRNSIKEVYDFIYNRYQKIPSISELAPNNIQSDKKNFFNSIYRSKRSSEEEYLKEDSKLSHITHNQQSAFIELMEFVKYYSINFYMSNIKALLQNKETFLPTNTCLPFSKKIYLTTKNKLLPCEKINHKYALGSIKENKVVIDPSQIASLYSNYYKNLQTICQQCYIYRFCGICMFSIEGLDNSNVDKLVCPNFHNIIDFKKKLKRIFSFIENNPDDLSDILKNITITI